MKKITILIPHMFVIGLLLCSRIIFAQDPVQYGTPFKEVPDARDAVIYQVNMRVFSETRDLKGVMSRLDDIKALGANVIQLMPVQPVGKEKAFNSPYCLIDLVTVGSEYGTLDDLRNLIDSAHALGMAVILDWIPNQTSWDHPWIKVHDDWYVKDENGNIKLLNGWTDIASLNFSNDSMKAEMIKAMRYWVFTVNCDGFRCDFADNTPIEFWQQAMESLRGIKTHKLLMLAEGERPANYTVGFNLNFSWKYYFGFLKPVYQSDSSVTKINRVNTIDYNSAGEGQQIVRFLTNHDLYGSDGSPYLLFGGRNGVIAAFVVSAYMKSVPFIYNGLEVGNTVAMPFPFTSSVINWKEDTTITPEMTKIIAFRNSSEAIRRGNLTSYANNDICAFTKVSGADTVFVACSFRDTTTTITLPSEVANSKWYDAYTDAPVSLEEILSLNAYEYKVLKNHNR